MPSLALDWNSSWHLEDRITRECTIKLVVLMHCFGIGYVFIKFECVFLMYLGSKGGVRFFRTLPRGTLVVQVTSTATLNEIKVFSSIRKFLARCGLLLFSQKLHPPCGESRDIWSLLRDRIRSLRPWSIYVDPQQCNLLFHRTRLRDNQHNPCPWCNPW